jgi:DNA modification methylase
VTYSLHLGDCLEVLPTIQSGSIDAVIADPPYGTTACKWDSVIPLGPMWAELKRVIKPNGAVVLFAAQPFTSALVMSNPQWFRYEWVADKGLGSGFLDAKRRPLNRHDSVLVFCEKYGTYNPQMTKGKRHRNGIPAHCGVDTPVYNEFAALGVYHTDEYFPTTIIVPQKEAQSSKVHPTQKPVDLLRYLIRTYTNPGETVLDFCYGSGTTGVAALMEGRSFVGIELDPGYFDIARKRIESVQPALMAAD